MNPQSFDSLEVEIQGEDGGGGTILSTFDKGEMTHV